MDERRPGGFSVVACRNCGLRVPMTTAIVHMGAAELFACPGCDHQEVWRNGVPVGHTTVTLSTRGAL
jgi:transcription elongation factor Elf1